MDKRVFSKTTIIDLTNAFPNFKIKQERGIRSRTSNHWLHLTFDKEKANQYEIDRKKEEMIAQFWKSDEPEPMPSAVAQTEYQNPELRKQKKKRTNIALDLATY